MIQDVIGGKEWCVTERDPVSLINHIATPSNFSNTVVVGCHRAWSGNSNHIFSTFNSYHNHQRWHRWSVPTLPSNTSTCSGSSFAVAFLLPVLTRIIRTNTSFEEQLAFSCETLVLCGHVFQSWSFLQATLIHINYPLQLFGIIPYSCFSSGDTL